MNNTGATGKTFISTLSLTFRAGGIAVLAALILARAFAVPLPEDSGKGAFPNGASTEAVPETLVKSSVAGVESVVSNPEGHAGNVVIAGVVRESHRRRGVFILEDRKPMGECQDSCCPQATLPVRYRPQEGSYFPAEGEEVEVRAILRPTPGGFHLDVESVGKLK